LEPAAPDFRASSFAKASGGTGCLVEAVFFPSIGKGSVSCAAKRQKATKLLPNLVKIRQNVLFEIVGIYGGS
jgi:hypothetical protein